MSADRGFSLRQIYTYKGVGAAGAQVVNVGKVLPATGTQNIFQVTGSVVVTNLVGIVTTVLSITAVHVTVGVNATGDVNTAAIAAAPASAYASTAVGSVIQMPDKLGDALPAAVVASGGAASVCEFEATNCMITVTTDATNTGAITWLLSYVPLIRKIPGSVAFQ